MAAPESLGPWLPGDPRPWLPGCPLINPAPVIASEDERLLPPGARTLLRDIVVDPRAPPSTLPPPGTYTGGLPNNIVNSLFSCVDGENQKVRIRNEWAKNYQDAVAAQPKIEPLPAGRSVMGPVKEDPNP